MTHYLRRLRYPMSTFTLHHGFPILFVGSVALHCCDLNLYGGSCVPLLTVTPIVLGP